MSAPPLPSIYTLLGLTDRIKLVDIGANPIDGDAPYKPLLQTGNLDVIGFEPNLQALEELQRRKGPNETYLPHAIGDGKRHTLHHTLGQGMTSLLRPNMAVLPLFYNFAELAHITRTEEIDTLRLDDIPETAGLDYLKIDIQGGELMVFENATDRLSQALLVHTEVEFLPMYENQPLYSDIDRFLREHGLMIHRFEPIYSRTFKPVDPYCGLNQLLWADAIFIRDITQPEKMDDGQLLRLAIILHECYRSYDVSLHLLNAHDKRTGSAYAPQYHNAIRRGETHMAFMQKAKG